MFYSICLSYHNLISNGSKQNGNISTLLLLAYLPSILVRRSLLLARK